MEIGVHSIGKDSYMRSLAYLNVYNILRKRIEEGFYPVGGILPSEPSLESQFNVSRTTIRKAVELLAGEGYLSVRQGKGSFVLDFRTTQRLNYITSFTETLRARGYEVSVKSMVIECLVPSTNILDKLMLPNLSQVVHIHRVIIANGKPIALMDNYIDAKIVPGIETFAGKFDSLYRFLESNYNLEIQSATDIITARAATINESNELAVPVGFPLLINMRVSYRNGSPIDYAVTTIDSQRYEFSISMIGRPPKI